MSEQPRARYYPDVPRRSNSVTPKDAPALLGQVRLDVQGLRAVAVVAVILNHALQWPVGGFIGVDMFFVISGFLITGLLLREEGRSGTISFAGFYRRRVKRIIPAALTVLVCTVIAANLTYSGVRAARIAGDAVSGLFFFANWRFAFAGTDYFQESGPTSPLQHFWSLGVEEQFYLVWPWLMLGVFALNRRLGWTPGSAQRSIRTTISVVAVASITWALWDTSTNATFAYFSTFSRAWELAVGALIAVNLQAISRIPDRLRPALAWIGITGIVSALFIVPTAPGFPTPWALLPTLSTGLVIAANVGGQERWLLPLRNPVAVWLGDLSYSLYVWHFPILIILADLFPPVSVWYYVAALLLTLSVAALSFYLIEDPVRRSSLFERRSRKKAVQLPRRTREVVVLVGLPALCVGLLCLVPIHLQPPPASALPPSNLTATPDHAATQSAASARLTASLAKAIQATTWPDLSPPLDRTTAMEAPQLVNPHCFNPTDLTHVGQCTSTAAGNSKRAVVVGDSVAMSWVPAVVKALQPEGYSVRSIGLSNCPVADVDLTFDAAVRKCNTAHKGIYNNVLDSKPDLIIVSDSAASLGRLTDKASGGAAVSEWVKGRTSALRTLNKSGAKIVLLGAPPDGKDIAQCFTRTSVPNDCAGRPSELWFQHAEGDAIAAKGVAMYVDPISWFCVQDYCPVFSGNHLIRWDGIHLTKQYATDLNTVLRERLNAALSP